MGQNSAAATLRAPGGGSVFAKADKSGNTLVSLANESHLQIAPSDTKQLLGATGAIGDELGTLTIVPTTTSPGQVGIYDSSAGTEIIVFAGGAASVVDLKPFSIEINATSAAGGWYVSTGANVSVIATGNFT